MQIRTLLTSGVLCTALGLFGSSVYAQSAATMDDAAIQADEAAEAEALEAEAVEDAAVVLDEVEAAGEAEKAKEAGQRGEKAFMETKK